MKKSKIYKYSAIVVLLALTVAGIVYSQLSNRHKAIVKTRVLHFTGLLNSNWTVAGGTQEYKMVTPTFLIDGIYKSMEGPKASRYIQLNQTQNLMWIKGFEVQAFDATTNARLSNDYICHMNVDINDVNYYNHWQLNDRIGKQYPRLTSLSQGLERFDFPEGYGVPIIGNDFLFVTSQTLNQNIPDIFKKVKHKITITYDTARNNIKPLMSKTVFIQLPFDQHDPFKGPLDPGSNQCIPVETKNHTYTDKNGNKLSGHWVIPTGSTTYRSAITAQLQIQDSARLHFSAPHVHPFATAISIYDKTAGKTVFSCKVINYKDKTGLREIQPFRSEAGVWFYGNHDYELVLDVNNTSATAQDMMGSMFLFFYDRELEKKIAAQ